jgi:hypothetical protein
VAEAAEAAAEVQAHATAAAAQSGVILTDGMVRKFSKRRESAMSRDVTAEAVGDYTFSH